MASVWLIGSGRGTFPVTIRQTQSMLLLMRDVIESQQPAVGEAPLLLLPVMKFMQGVKVLIMEAVQGKLTCALVEPTENTTNMDEDIAMRDGKVLNPSAISFCGKSKAVKNSLRVSLFTMVWWWMNMSSARMRGGTSIVRGVAPVVKGTPKMADGWSQWLIMVWRLERHWFEGINDGQRLGL
ncbi:hypothetical protein U1Q18_001226 [Sarracenia purpurea var. burkii]